MHNTTIQKKVDNRIIYYDVRSESYSTIVSWGVYLWQNVTGVPKTQSSISLTQTHLLTQLSIYLITC